MIDKTVISGFTIFDFSQLFIYETQHDNWQRFSVANLVGKQLIRFIVCDSIVMGGKTNKMIEELSEI